MHGAVHQVRRGPEVGCNAADKRGRWAFSTGKLGKQLLTSGLQSYMPLFLHGEEIMRHTRLVVRLTGLGEAQAEGVVAVLALFLLVLGTALLAHWA